MKLIYLISLWVLYFNITPAQAKLYIHPEKSIKSFWGETASIKEKSLVLTKEQSEKSQKEARIIFKDKVFRYYQVLNANKPVGKALLITRKVRTKNITLLVGIDNQQKIEFIETIALSEPPEYKPKNKWLKQSYPSGLTALELNKDMPHISGATLSAQAVYDSVKWALQLVKQAL